MAKKNEVEKPAFENLMVRSLLKTLTTKVLKTKKLLRSILVPKISTVKSFTIK